MAEIRHQLIGSSGSLSHYLQGFIHPKWLFGISEPSTVSPKSYTPTTYPIGLYPTEAHHQDEGQMLSARDTAIFDGLAP